MTSVLLMGLDRESRRSHFFRFFFALPFFIRNNLCRSANNKSDLKKVSVSFKGLG
jgi:hypothetical protein